MRTGATPPPIELRELILTLTGAKPPPIDAFAAGFTTGAIPPPILLRESGLRVTGAIPPPMEAGAAVLTFVSGFVVLIVLIIGEFPFW
ncbi:hypothetical protein [uncultured Roseibium sp.]|uniref:hypothetical protein n=1 Tax=uncultured Roseibium sp. TaxID=1936171 RepID=UPI002623E744|nr:hypothetical protein [uncultured Roseibium sp.]